jgi:ABC-type lipoprotein release transport system permease subunit
MISDIEEKTYEMAMLRALGLRSASLFNMILLQSFVFSIPGCIIGLAIAIGANVLIRHFVFKFTLLNIGYFIATSTLILGVCLGLLMPILTNLLTVNKALSKNIRDSLDLFHTGASDAVVKIKKLANYGISVFQFCLAIVLLSFGLMTYYLAPAAFLFDRLDIFFFVLNFILICMIMGLSLISVLIFPYIQQAIVHIICW